MKTIKNTHCSVGFLLPQKSNRWFTLITLCAGLLSLPAYGSGSTWIWNGGGGANANWNNAANWFSAGIPGNGDTVVFQGAVNLLNTNNIASLTLNQIKFLNGGFDIRGNAFTLTNSILATNTVGNNTIENSITLATTDVQVNVIVGLTLSGTLSGSVGLVKTGAGTLTLAGPDFSSSYTGDTTVNTGVLQLNSINVIRYGTLTIGDGIGGANADVVRYLKGGCIFGGPGGSTVVINNSGLLDLNGFTDDVGPITMDAGIINTGAGLLQLFPPLATVSSGSGASTINGNFQLRDDSTLAISNNLNMNASVSSSGTYTLTKAGTGFLLLNASNSYSGLTVIQQGWIGINNAFALGTTANGTVVSNGATLYMNGNFGVTNEALTLNGPGEPAWGSLDSETGSGTNVWAGPITLNADSVLAPYAGGSVLRINGQISGPAGFSEFTGSSGTLVLEGSTANTYGGTTTVNSGTMLLGKPFATQAVPGPLVMGSGTTVRLLQSFQIDDPTTPVTMADSSLLDLAGFSEWVGATSLQGAQITSGTGIFYFSSNITVNASTVAQSIISGNAQIYGGTYTITNVGHNYSPDLLISANLSSGGGSGGLIKAGAGEVSLAGNNSFVGPVTVNGGNLWAQTSTAFGNTNTTATVNNGGSIFLDGNIVIGLKPLVLNGPGYAFGALSSAFGASSWSGTVNLAGDSVVSVNGASDSLTFSNTITGPGGLTKTGPGTLVFSGGTANTYAGTTTVGGGTLLLNKSAAFAAVPGNLVINNGATARLASYQQTVSSADVLVNGSGLFDFSTFYTYMDTLRGTGTVNFGVGGYIYLGLNNGTSEFDGSFTGTGFAPGFTVGKTGSGTFTIGGNSTYTVGITHVYSGKVIVNGSQFQVPVTVDAVSTLGGSGTVGSITANGTIAPGNSPGILTCSNVTFSATGKLIVELTGPTLGSGYDQLNSLILIGANTLANATLQVVPTFITPVATGQQFTILNNSTPNPLSGTFNGLPQGSTITAGGYKFTISYIGGTGNDVVLTLTSIPGAVTGSAVTSGNGSHGIDPNGCNNLSLVISNMTGSAMTGINATLSTTTPGVLITQPYSSYPNIPASGMGTNSAPFQISTLPTFVCGTPINLQLIVDSSLGSFTMNLVQTTAESAAPLRFDNNNVTNCPDVGTIESTNTVASWTGGAITKVTVSLWLVAPFSSDMTLTLFAPDGTAVPLASGAGLGANFGSGSADASRTTFDDAAATAIAAGASPFVGTFRPQSPLSAFIGTTAAGAWHLRIQDSFGSGSPDTLRAWSLFLSGTTCATGSGVCDLCMPAITNAITASDPVQTGRWIGNLVVASCGIPKTWAGTSFGSLHYNAYSFTNTSPADACVTVELQSPSNILATAYLNSFNPANITTNYLGDAGNSTHGGVTSFSCTVSAGATFQVVVTEVTAGAGTQPYTLQLSGLPCPPPTLSIQPVPANKARLNWPTWAGGYLLESGTNLASSAWATVTNEPIVSTLKYNVTNSISSPTNRFYRLHKP